jgi:hypothetical protein
MVVLITDGRANISLAKSNEDPDALAPDAPKPTQVRPVGLSIGVEWVGSGPFGRSPTLRIRPKFSSGTSTNVLTTPLFLPTPLLQDELKDEVRDMAKRLGAAGMNLLVIDTGGLGGVATARCCLLVCWEDARVLLCLVSSALRCSHAETPCSAHM